MLLSFVIFLKYFVNILEGCVCVMMEAITPHRVGRPKLPGSLKSIPLRESVLNLWRDRKQALGFSERTGSVFAV